jgi:hypothetical protein
MVAALGTGSWQVRKALRFVEDQRPVLDLWQAYRAPG